MSAWAGAREKEDRVPASLAEHQVNLQLTCGLGEGDLQSLIARVRVFIGETAPSLVGLGLPSIVELGLNSVLFETRVLLVLNELGINSVLYESCVPVRFNSVKQLTYFIQRDSSSIMRLHLLFLPFSIPTVLFTMVL